MPPRHRWLRCGLAGWRGRSPAAVAPLELRRRLVPDANSRPIVTLTSHSRASVRAQGRSPEDEAEGFGDSHVEDPGMFGGIRASWADVSHASPSNERNEDTAEQVRRGQDHVMDEHARRRLVGARRTRRDIRRSARGVVALSSASSISFAVEHIDRTFGAHHCDLGRGPRQHEIGPMSRASTSRERPAVGRA